jgi:uncharacterized membrane protein
MGIVLGLVAAVVWLLITFVLPVLAFLRASRAVSDAAALRSRVAALEAHLRDLTAAYTGRVHEAPIDIAAGPSEASETVPAAALFPPLPVSTTPHVEQAPQPSPIPTQVADPAPGGHGAAAHVTEPPSAGDTRTEGEARGLEEAIGGRFLLYVGTVVLVLGAAFFLKYAFDREWITESMRVVLGGAVGMALVVGGLRLGRAGYDAYGQMLTGGGLAVLYLAIYAAFGFYGLIGSGLAFTLLTMVTIVSA